MSKAGVAKTQEFRKPRKRKKVTLEERVIDGEVVVGKECTKCGEWKPLDGGFGTDTRGVGGKTSACRLCKREVSSNWYIENKERKLDSHRKWREENKEYYRKYYEENKGKVAGITRKWRQHNPEKYVLTRHRRSARKKALPSDFTIEHVEKVLTHFRNRCVLTDSTDFHWDHVIPISIGHGGTVYGNMIPLRGDLNESKGDKNIFDWFKTNRQRFELSYEKFNFLIEWLAFVNGKTVQEYRDYVYWCHENPRTLENLETESEVMS
ncbi:hypothetical protein [Bacillus gaemokensis]|uniref:HNH nuclease domain-containing protein n=1 Tax=Bacillus gaemokensis TaxID=574375 RepID=A0A073KJL6_9BACI|nr:hypothetical protein [Bacillus gaemokensis]KEK22513.1 hypothetical protein BAGA_19130 [Bacillus gaemokensis]KYG28790.1 hypothetical protein AZF08_13780 [Bacillus gaemokensis]